jgi:hypothetical protein
MLAQESLEVRRGAEREPMSPLRRLLESALFGSEERRRGGTDVNPTTFNVKVVTWLTEAAR